MKIAILSTAILKEIDTSTGADRPEYRKATRKMRNCLGVAELCLKRLPTSLQSDLKTVDYKNMCTILGTSFGEAEVTREFLVTLDQMALARPILFQNSLHNAVTGFITLTLGLRGPSITVSHRYSTAENALETAQLLMNNQNPFGLVICGEIVVQDFVPGYDKIYPGHAKLCDGAAAVFVATQEAVREFNLRPLAWIESITTQPQARNVFTDTNYYDSNGLEKLIESKLKESLVLTKPDGSTTKITGSWL